AGAVALPNLSLGKALELFFDLNLGMLPYLPLALLGAVAAPLVQIASGRQARPLVALWAVLLGMALICSSSGNWNHGTSGPSRYTIWMLPLVLVILASMLEPGATNERTRRAFGGWAVAALAVQAVIVVSRGGLAPRLDYLEHSYLASFVLKHAPALYNPTPEIFVERTIGEEMRDGEISSGGTAVAYAPEQACRKALAQKRHWPDLLARCGSAAHQPPFDALAAANRRDEWVYVDYP
ncbi:MAG TPA: hypothetical protein VMV21_02315, partial [Vicinamibacteria bacterium]|nr:hypothetical protein [Vicinamibacteria bacterium]